MTQCGVEEPREAFVESEDGAQSNGTIRSIASRHHVARGDDDWTKPRETAETKGELLSREDVHDICGACKTHTRCAPSCGSPHSGARSARRAHTPSAGKQRPQAMRLEV